MKATRRRFSREFKLEAVRQLAAGTRLADVARQVSFQVLRTVASSLSLDAVH